MNNNEKIHILIAKAFEDRTSYEIDKDSLRAITFDSSAEWHTMFFEDICLLLKLSPESVGHFPDGKMIGEFIDTILPIWDGSYSKEPFVDLFDDLYYLLNEEAKVSSRKKTPTIEILKVKLEYGPTAKKVLKEALAQGFDINTSDANGETLLHYFTKRCFAMMMDLCITAGAKVDHQNNKGEQPIHYADSMESAEILIDAGADINALTNDGRTVLNFEPYSDFALYLKENGVTKKI